MHCLSWNQGQSFDSPGKFNPKSFVERFKKRISFQMQWRIYFHLKRRWQSNHFVDQSINTIKDKQPLKMKRASHLIEPVCFQNSRQVSFSRANSQRQRKYKCMGNVLSNREIGDDRRRPPKTENFFQIERASLQKKIPLKTKNHKWQKEHGRRGPNFK